MHKYKIKLDETLLSLINTTLPKKISSNNIWVAFGLTGEICFYEYKENHYILILAINETNSLFSMFQHFFYVLSHVIVEEK